MKPASDRKGRRASALAATRASGTTAVRYGTMRDNTIALEASLADGTLVQFGPASRRAASCCNIRRYLCVFRKDAGIVEVFRARHKPGERFLQFPEHRSPFF